MSDGREEREHEQQRREQETPQQRRDRLDYEEDQHDQPERGGS